MEQARKSEANRLPSLLAGLAILCAWGSLWNELRTDWSINDQYQYGWFVPPLALALLWLRWPDRPMPAPRRSPAGWLPGAIAFVGLLLLLPIRLIEQPNPDWRLFFWAHAGLLTLLSLALAMWTGGWPWVKHFGFPILFVLVAVPWPSGPEQSIVQSLMRTVAAISAEGMNLLGIPAVPQGNLIHIRDQTVGVNEACSGIRSLQTMLMGSLFLGELSRLTWVRRLVLLFGGVAVAMAANVFRSSLLVWIAARYGTAALERFHDAAGISVLIIVFGGLLALNRKLDRPRRVAVVAGGRDGAAPAVSGDGTRGAVRNVPLAVLVAALFWLGAVEVGVAAWYRSGEQPGARKQVWTAVAPTDAPGYESIKIDDRSSSLLRFDRGFEAHWTRGEPTAAACTLFFFRWDAGHASLAQAEMHQPHICLTASGLTQVADWGIQPMTLRNGITLPVRRYEFSMRGQDIFVFFVAIEDSATGTSLADAPTNRWDRLRAVAERRPNLGRQTLEFIVTGPSNPENATALFDQEIEAIVRPAS